MKIPLHPGVEPSHPEITAVPDLSNITQSPLLPLFKNIILFVNIFSETNKLDQSLILELWNKGFFSDSMVGFVAIPLMQIHHSKEVRKKLFFIRGGLQVEKGGG